MPLVQTRGAASAQGFGEFAQAAAPANWIDDVFSTYLWDGNSTARNIVNGIDLATYGGMVWAKYRNATASNRLYDTNRGATKQIFSDLTNAEQVAAQSLTAFNTDGFSLGTGQPNETTATVVGWTFREQAKFFDIVTGTGGGTFNHSLGVTPGMIIIKVTSGTGDWWTVHRSSNGYFYLNSSAAAAGTGTPGIASTGAWVNASSTTFSTSNFVSSGETFVAYLFAHDAGGFGTAGTDNVISCGTFTSGASVTSVTLGYEPQYVLIKRSDDVGGWLIFDTMRGYTVQGQPDNYLLANSSDAEVGGSNYGGPTATGFDWYPSGTQTYIYMAIRRPMKPPTSGTQVFSVTSGNFSTPYTVTTGFPVDLCYSTRTGGSARHFNDRLRGGTTTSYRYLATNTTDAELTGTSAGIGFQSNTSIIDNDWVTGANAVWWNFRRASGFFDEVCYTGTGVATTQAHNLTVVPELMIVKCRNDAEGWNVYSSTIGNTKYLALYNTDGALTSSTKWNNTTPTSSVFTVGTSVNTNYSGFTYVAYLFATVAGVSKVGSYTGNGGTQAIACGFTGGARFVLIKRTDDLGGWYIYDTARGMTLLTDPYLFANTSTAQTATLGSVTTTTGGFTVDATVLAAINTNAASYIFLAIA